MYDGLAASGDYDQAMTEAEGTFALAVAEATPRQWDAVREAAFARRLVWQLGASKLEAGKRAELLKYLRANDELARTLAFLVKTRDNVPGVYALLDKLRAKHGAELDKYANLTAAVCVVHDVPFERWINENELKSPDAVAIWEYYKQNEGAMLFGVQNVPAELLEYVVDTTASIDEMKWALGRYAKDPMVGRRFFDIQYDYDAFRKGTKKKVTEMGYNLQNILKYGGVCADQAYFAMAVGKAIGVPTAYAVGESAEAGHAWVGFLQAQGTKGWWNFDMGRYEEYRGIKGTVEDPQTGEAIPDSYVSLLAELIGTKAADRETAVALTDAAAELMWLDANGKALTPPALPAGVEAISNGRRTPRKADVEGELELLQAALGQNVGYAPAWFAVRNLAHDGKLTLEQKKKWSEAVLRLCGAKYPDFALAVLKPMVQTVDDVAEQNRIWNAASAVFAGRADLSAEIRMAQAAMWVEAGKPQLAGQCYEDVITKYANAGPFVLKALAGAEAMLAQTGQRDKVVTLYGDTWKRINKPQDAGIAVPQSNWYVVGKMYAEKLGEAGDKAKAQAVKGALEEAAKLKG